MALKSAEIPLLEITGVLLLRDSLLLSSVLIFLDLSRALDNDDDLIRLGNMQFIDVPPCALCFDGIAPCLIFKPCVISFLCLHVYTTDFYSFPQLITGDIV